MKISISKNDTDIISKPFVDDYRVIPSERVYYGNYPYRVKLDVGELPFITKPDLPDQNTGRQFALMWYWRLPQMVHDFIKLGVIADRPEEAVEDVDKFHNRTLNTTFDGKHAISMYCKDSITLDYLHKKYPNAILEIAGPISDQHRNHLWGSTSEVTVKNKPWWGKYDYAYTFWVRWKYTRNNITGLRGVHSEIRDYLKDNVEGDYRFSSASWQAKIFIDNEESVNNLMPFLMLQFPNVEITYHKLYLIDKQLHRVGDHMPINRRSVILQEATGTTMTAISEAVKGDSYYGYTDGLHTIQVIYSQYVGRFRIQGTLSLEPTATDWFDIYPASTTGKEFNRDGYIQFNANDPRNASEAYTFQGNYTYIRTKVDRDHVGDGVTYDSSYGQINRIILSS